MTPCTLWYDHAPPGKDPLDNLMKILSEDAKLSQINTNHSIRSMALTTLDGNNIASRHIQALFGHKSEATINPMPKDATSEKERMFNLLQLDKSSDPTPPPKVAKTSTVSKANDANAENSDLNDMDFFDFVLFTITMKILTWLPY